MTSTTSVDFIVHFKRNGIIRMLLAVKRVNQIDKAQVGKCLKNVYIQNYPLYGYDCTWTIPIETCSMCINTLNTFQ